ncbi:MAG: DNA repair protein RecO [Candidatus Falkowbacteria bacterium]|nr:DNA repair protein RecO [Candidatus Falkowbacteria bacterium]
MPQTISTPAICLACRPWKEQDLMVDVYTLEQGKVRLLVRGGRRLASKLAAHLEPLTLLELMVISGKGMSSAAAASSRNCYPSLKGDYDKIAAAGFAIYHFNRLTEEGVKDEKIFHLLSDFFALLNEAKAEAEWYHWFAKIFLMLALERLGYGPEAHKDFKIEPSLYTMASQSLDRKKFKEMNRWLDKLLPVAIANAL